MLTADPVTHFHTQGYVVIPAMAHAVYCRTVISFAQHALREHAEPIEYEADTHYPGAPESREVEGGQTARRILQAATQTKFSMVFTYRGADNPPLFDSRSASVEDILI